MFVISVLNSLLGFEPFPLDIRSYGSKYSSITSFNHCEKLKDSAFAGLYFTLLNFHVIWITFILRGCVSPFRLRLFLYTVSSPSEA